MSDDLRRRRRLPQPSSPRRGGNGGGGINPWLVTGIAAVVVIAGGWFLGQALARVFNGRPQTARVAQAQSPLPMVTALPSPSPAATPAPTPTAAPTATPAATPSAQPTPTLAPTPTPAPSPTASPAEATAEPTAEPTATPRPKATAAPPLRHTQPIARRTEAPATAQPQSESPAARVVRDYIEALRRGDPAVASTYLGNGTPDETFIDAHTRIASLTATPNGDGSYKVDADMQTSKGEYYETFTVASGRILQKTAIKP